MKKSYIIYTLITMLMIGGLIFILQNLTNGNNKGDFCINSTDYTYNKELNSCISAMGLNSEQIKAAKISISFLDTHNYSNLTLISIKEVGCPGCFDLSFEQPNNKNIGVNVQNWEVASWGDAVEDFLAIH